MNIIRDITPPTRLLPTLLSDIALVMAGADLKSPAGAMVPVVLALSIALPGTPLARRIAGALPDRLNWLGLIVVMLPLLALTSDFVAGLICCGHQIIARFPDTSGMLTNPFPEESSSPLLVKLRGLIFDNSGSVGNMPLSQIQGISQTVASAAGLMMTGAPLVIFLVLLALSEMDLWRAKLDGLTGTKV